VQPTAAFDAGIEYRHVFAGARALVPLSRTEGNNPHDVWGFGSPALLGQLGFRL
jgi:hypothetical protein